MNIDKSLLVTSVSKVTLSRTDALNRLNSDFTKAMANLQSGWPDYEVKTWDIQSEEAKQWTAASADDKPMTPFLTQLFNQRAALGWVEPFADLVSRIMANTQNYTLATANYIAIRHVAERDINAASDPSKVQWSF